jgi:2-alkenal reductase
MTKQKTTLYLACIAIALALLACRAGAFLPGKDDRIDQPVIEVQEAVPQTTLIAPVISIPAPVDLLASQDTLTGLYENAHNGVVSIRVLTPTGGGLGSGFVFDRNGHIVTNYHVVADEQDLEVAFASGFKARGRVVGTDLDSDLAVIQVDVPPETLHPLPVGDSDLIQVGQTVVAIGNPFGLEGTMTVGIVSGLGRTLQSLHSTADGGSFTAGDMIQTDASINPGNSGGPLLNLNGEVIGINQAIRTTSYNEAGDPLNSGVGFAISVNIVKRVVPSLIANGKYDYPYMGIYSNDDITLAEQEALGLPQSTGVYVTQVTPNGPADRAGIRGGSRRTSIPGLDAGGDLIVGIDDQPVYNFNDMIGYLVREKSPGDIVVLRVLRDGEELEIELTLDKRPEP